MSILNKLTRKVSAWELSCKQTVCEENNQTFKIKFSQFQASASIWWRIRSVPRQILFNLPKWNGSCPVTTSLENYQIFVFVLPGNMLWLPNSGLYIQHSFCPPGSPAPLLPFNQLPSRQLFARWLKCWIFPGQWKPFVFGGNQGLWGRWILTLFSPFQWVADMLARRDLLTSPDMTWHEKPGTGETSHQQ